MGNEDDVVNMTADDELVDENQVDEPAEQDEPEDEAKQEGTKAKAAQSRAENAEFAKQRREAERKKAEAEQERLKKDAFSKGKIEGLGGKNPYTNEPISNEYDLHIYELMKKLDDEGKDPVKGLAKAISDEQSQRKAKEDEEKRKADEEEGKKRALVETLKANVKALGEKYPEANLEWFQNEYSNNANFKKLCDHGLTPIEAVEILGIEFNGKERSTPSSYNGGSRKSKSIMDMSDDEFLAYKNKRRGDL